MGQRRNYRVRLSKPSRANDPRFGVLPFFNAPKGFWMVAGDSIPGAFLPVTTALEGSTFGIGQIHRGEPLQREAVAQDVEHLLLQLLRDCDPGIAHGQWWLLGDLFR